MNIEQGIRGIAVGLGFAIILSGFFGMEVCWLTAPFFATIGFFAGQGG